MMKKIAYSILAGISISIGAIAYLLCENKIVGAALFSVGILLVMEFKFLLYTGYCPTQREGQKFLAYVGNSTLVFFGNLAGAGITAGLMALTKLQPKLYEACVNVCEAKMSGAWYSTIILAVFCGFIIAGIVKATNLKKQMIYVVLMIVVFILCGYEHVVANAFYFSMSLKLFTLEGVGFMLLCLLGNFIGGLLCSFIPNPKENN